MRILCLLLPLALSLRVEVDRSRVAPSSIISTFSSGSQALKYPPSGHLPLLISGLKGGVVFLNFFKLSRIAPPSVVSPWLAEGQDLSLSSLPLTQVVWSFYRGRPDTDAYGDACMGYFQKAEVCVQASSCFKGPYYARKDSGMILRVEVPIRWAGEFHVEVFEAGEEEGWTCDEGGTPRGLFGGSEEVDLEKETVHLGDEGHYRSVPPSLQYSEFLPRVQVWEVPNLADNTNISSPFFLPKNHENEAKLEVLIEYADEVSFWWGKGEGLRLPFPSWMEFMRSSLEAALPLIRAGGQVLEFGVASGRSLAFLSQVLAEEAPGTVVRGFDSFHGLPLSWGRYQEKTFDLYGTPPFSVLEQENIVLEVGWFNETLPLVEWSGVGLMHIDSDLYESAIEVLSSLSCLLVPGSVVVFDEWFNMRGTYGGMSDWFRTGEFRAWDEASSLLGIQWRSLGGYFEQAWALQVTSTAAQESDHCQYVAAEMERRREDMKRLENEASILSAKQAANLLLRQLRNIQNIQGDISQFLQEFEKEIEKVEKKEVAYSLVRELLKFYRKIDPSFL